MQNALISQYLKKFNAFQVKQLHFGAYKREPKLHLAVIALK